MSESQEQKPPVELPIEIPVEQLSSDALYGIIENFVLREGTDYGPSEISLEKKITQIHRQIEKGEVKIVFDQTAETVSLLTASEFKRFSNKIN